MAKCEDCNAPVVWLKRPDGGWMPPAEPVLDFAYTEHWTATVDGIATAVPHIYKRHQCLSPEERQLKKAERERERQELIEADRARREEAERVQRELEAEELARQERQASRKRAKVVDETYQRASRWFTQRLLPFPCAECGAVAGEACRTNLWGTRADPYVWWEKTGHNSRYVAAPPDDRSSMRMVERWGEDYDPHGDKGTTPETCGPWPPSKLDGGGFYDMRNWLRAHYIDVFEPKRRWMTDAEESTLTEWLHQFGDMFEEVSDGPEGVADVEAGDGAEGTGGGHARSEGSVEDEGDHVHSQGRADDVASPGEQGDRGEGTQ